MTEWVITFLSVFVLDIVYTYYLRCVAKDNVLGASFWSVACYIFGSLAVINYTTNNWLVIPAILGAFCGTYLGMIIRNKHQE
jgi:uncharacterized membrane protein YfcA